MGKDQVKAFTEMIDVCEDSRKGLWQAALQLDNKTFGERLRKEAFQRNAFAYDLQDLARDFGVAPLKKGSFWGKLHRNWMSFRHRLNPHHDKVLLLECQRGEEHALQVYQDVFENKLLPEIQPILEEQFVSMIEMRDKLVDITGESKRAESSNSLLRLDGKQL